MEDITCRVQTVKSRLVWCRALQRTQTRVDGGQKRAPPGHMLIPGRTPCTAYLRGDPMREVGGVGLLPALCRRRTACRRNVLRSRRNMTVSSLPGAVMARDIMGRSDVCGGDIFMGLCHTSQQQSLRNLLLGLQTVSLLHDGQNNTHTGCEGLLD